MLGAGIAGLWQALILARAGHRVTLCERSVTPFADAASRYAGAMLAPECEAEGAEPIVRTLGHESLALWRQLYPGVVNAGSLVVAPARDRSELARFARMTQGHARIDGDAIGRLEPDLAGRFGEGLFFADEAHVTTPDALAFLLDAARRAGAEIRLGVDVAANDVAAEAVVIDCRGMAARADIPTLRGVRGERLVVATKDVTLARPVRLLHPRHPLYVVPWGDGRFMVGATVIESDDAGAMTVRSALELLGLAYALHPGFGEAALVEMTAGVRPALPDNVPHVFVRDRHILVNGMYRHGFLTAPALASRVAAYLATGTLDATCMSTA